jgi:DNA-binding MarR family transcriptional regulator
MPTTIASELTPPIFHAVDVALVRRVQTARKARASFFDARLFSDPAWDIILEIYASDLEHLRKSISHVSAAAGVPATTALRWIKTLEESGIVARESDPLDGRRIWLTLTPRGTTAMHAYLDSVSITSLPI